MSINSYTIYIYIYIYLYIYICDTSHIIYIYTYIYIYTKPTEDGVRGQLSDIRARRAARRLISGWLRVLHLRLVVYLLNLRPFKSIYLR